MPLPFKRNCLPVSEPSGTFTRVMVPSTVGTSTEPPSVAVTIEIGTRQKMSAPSRWKNECGLMARKIMPAMVQADIQPYRPIAVDKETGKVPIINSRKQHREFLLRNDYVEVGSDPIKERKQESTEPDAPMLSVEEMKRNGFVEEAF